MLKYPAVLFLTALPVIFTAVYLSMSGKAFEHFYTYSHLKDKGRKKNAFLWKRNISALSICASAVFLVIALASPFSVDKPVSTVSDNISPDQDYSFVVDISNSMTADDGGISRLEQVKNTLISYIFSDRKSSRYSVTVFKGSAAVLLPLTSDRKLAASVIEKLSPDMFTSKGTAFSSAVESAAAVFPDHEKTDRKMILFTDGEESDKGSFERDIKKLAGIINSKMIHTMIIMPDNGSGSVIDDGNISHISIPDFSLMEKAADSWGGSVVRISDFSAADYQNRRFVQGGKKEYRSFFLIMSLMFMYGSLIAGRIRL